MIKKIITKIALATVLMGTSASAYTAFIGDDFDGGRTYDHKTSGSEDWVAPWVEFGDSSTTPFSNPKTGAIQISDNSHTLRFGDGSSNGMTTRQSIVRSLNLEGKKNVVLKFDFAAYSFGSAKLYVDMWDDTNSVWVNAGYLVAGDTGVQATLSTPRVLTRNAKIRFNSGGTNWPSNAQATVDNLKFEFDYKDTDGDMVGDEDDLDDDNDGILDSVENNALFEGELITTSWVRYDNNKMTGKLGDLDVVLEDENSAFVTFVSPPAAAFNPHDKDFWSSDTITSLQATPSNFLETEDNSGLWSSGKMKITLPKATKRVLIHVDRLGAYSSSTSTSAKFTLNPGTDFIMTMGNSNGNLEVDENNKFFQRKLGVGGQTHTDSNPGSGGATDGSSAGTIIIENNTAFTVLEFDVDGVADGVYMIIESESEETGPKDSDGDGISDQYDLDSDNDGIPDSIEAQPTSGVLYIQGGTDVNVDGVPTEAGSGWSTPLPDKNGDGVPDFLDNDSDDDDISDCAEGNIATKDNCPITDVLPDGMALAAGSDGSYGKIHGNIDDITTDLYGYHSTLDEASYRITQVCGRSTWPLTSMQWKTISVPCLIDNGIEDIFKKLGKYGDDKDWVMYEQTTSFTGSPSADFTTAMPADARMVLGKGYWIITNKDLVISIDETAGLLNIDKTMRVLPVHHSVTSPNFTEVHNYDALPDSTGDEQKVILGNPFPVPFQLGDLFVSNNDGSNYYPMYNDVDTSFTNKIVYVYGNNGINYVSKTANGTPGFGDEIVPGGGFWYRLNPTGSGVNKIDYPFTK